MSARTFRTADDRPQIMRIFHTVCQNKKRGFSSVFCRLEQIVQRSVFFLCGKGYNAFDLANEFGQRKEAQAPIEHLGTTGNISYSADAPYSDSYKAGGDNALIDGVRGGWTYTDKKWQGFIRNGVDVTIDLGTEKSISNISADFMQMCIPDVWFPAKVTISLSNDGETFKDIAVIEHNVVRDEGLSFKNYGWNGNDKGRYVRYRA